MEIWTAFLIGLAGSLHCIGMCGPIAIALPVGDVSRTRHVVGRVSYNLGRVLTYALLGVGAGLVGQTIRVSGYQQVLSIVLGSLILLAVILPGKFGAILFGSRLHARLFEPIRRYWGRLFGQNSVRSMFVVGVLNGFLPCGLVYVALAGAATTGAPLPGALYMAVFGLGTFPVMFAMSWPHVRRGFRTKLRRLVPVGGDSGIVVCSARMSLGFLI
jgi:sulfite exporter TauE/SafE